MAYTIGQEICLFLLQVMDNRIWIIHKDFVVKVKTIGEITFAANNDYAFMLVDSEWIPVMYERELSRVCSFRDAIVVSREVQASKEIPGASSWIILNDRRPLYKKQSDFELLNMAA